VWAIDADALGDSPLDPIVAILDEQGEPVLRTRLQATLSSYFAFRGQNSSTTDGFRLFDWKNMRLNQYLYAAGEVSRLWMHPRGPDSGFMLYPGEGSRWTYFGTSPLAHALGEPAYIVEPLADGEPALDNGLPVFDVPYENDDDPQRVAGVGSRLVFTAPADGRYTVRVADTRGHGGEDFAYRLAIRAAEPGFTATASKVTEQLRRGAGREFVVRVDRRDAFDGPVDFDIAGLPEGVVSNSPLTIEAGQRFAVGVLWVPEDHPGWDGAVDPTLTAHATINGRRVERFVGSIGELEVGDPPTVIPSLQPIVREVDERENWVLKIRRGETRSARVVIDRRDDFADRVSFGAALAGRNATHGVYVDNIGLNGLMIVENTSEREFFLTADPTAEPGRRSLFLTAQVEGNLATQPITVEVLP